MLLNSSRSVVLMSPWEAGSDLEGAPSMRFRLTYEGELRANQRDPMNGQSDRLAEHKQSIRKVFHKQLKELWNSNPFLSGYEATVGMEHAYVSAADPHLRFGPNKGDVVNLGETIANRHRENGYRFLPLVCEDFSLLCNLEILFLRRDPPGSILHAGDVDNRIKTLIDTLRKPKGSNELRGNEYPDSDEDPFYCLLEDDKLVTGFSVETDMLLSPSISGKVHDVRDVKIVISVEIKPMNATKFNLGFL